MVRELENCWIFQYLNFLNDRSWPFAACHDIVFPVV